MATVVLVASALVDRKRIRVLVAGLVVALMAAGSAAAFQALPPGAQVNDDLAAGIDKTVDVSSGDPANADVVGGALTAGKPAVPWAVFQQQEANADHDQVFVRSFAAGAWTTRGSGTFNGRSSATPKFSGSLNFDQTQDSEAPEIDFAGAGRTVPWATWYENTTGANFDKDNIFASRFDNTGDANQGKWIFAGQDRGLGGGSVQIPSLNIHTDEKAENPSVAGGSATDPTKPGPWITWQETTPTSGKNQIFVVRPEGPGEPNCDGVTPAGTVVGTDVPSVGGFCWQQTGVPRVGAGPDPSLNVDPTRDGVEPDIAFTGANDSVPWVVWYEENNSGIGLQDNEMVFAAKGISDTVTGNGGFHWVAVGSALQAPLDATGSHGFGNCAESVTNEQQCSLNKDPTADAEDPRVAAGTMDPASPTAPWVVWDEVSGTQTQVFVARLVGGATGHFVLANNGAPISTGANGSARADITFSGNTPYVSWREDTGNGADKAFIGHFVNPANPTFVLDESDVPLEPSAQVDVREPISSSCIATPFDTDGAACQGGALGTPFFLSTSGTPRGLFANAYQADPPVTGAPSAVATTSATVSASDNPEGAAVNVSFQYGTTTAYGLSTPAQKTGPDNAADPFSAALTGLPAATTIHYRAVAVSDFGTFVGADQTLTTNSPTPAPPPPPAPAPAPKPNPPAPGPGKTSAGHLTVSGSTAHVRVSCTGATGSKCQLVVTMTVTETFSGHRLTAVTARKRAKQTHKVVVVGTTKTTLTAGQTHTLKIGLNGTGKRLLASRHRLQARLSVTQTLANRKTKTVFSRIVTFTVPKPHKKH